MEDGNGGMPDGFRIPSGSLKDLCQQAKGQCAASDLIGRSLIVVQPCHVREDGSHTRNFHRSERAHGGPFLPRCAEIQHEAERRLTGLAAERMPGSGREDDERAGGDGMHRASDLLNAVAGKIKKRLPVGMRVGTKFCGFGKVPVQSQAECDCGTGSGVEAGPKEVPEQAGFHGDENITFQELCQDNVGFVLNLSCFALTLRAA